MFKKLWQAFVSLFSDKCVEEIAFVQEIQTISLSKSFRPTYCPPISVFSTRQPVQRPIETVKTPKVKEFRSEFDSWKKNNRELDMLRKRVLLGT